MKSAKERLKTTHAVLSSMGESDSRLKAANTAIRIMDVVRSIENPLVKARVLVAHHRRCPNSRLALHAVYSRKEAEATIRAFTNSPKYNTPNVRYLVPHYNRRLQNIENGGGVI